MRDARCMSGGAGAAWWAFATLRPRFTCLAILPDSPPVRRLPRTLSLPLMLRTLPLLALALLAVAACAPSSPVPSPQTTAAGSDSLRIVVIGSSTAAGVGPADRDSTWVERYRAYLTRVDPRFAVTNLAVGGYTTFHLAPTGTVAPAGMENAPDPERNINAALSLRPDAILVNLPSNDTAMGIEVAAQMANFDAMVDAATEAGVPIWLMTPQPRDFEPEHVQVQLELLADMRAAYGDHAIDFWTGLADPDGQQAERWDSGDHLHYNSAGHRVFFERVRDAGIAEAVQARR